ncbi:MAG TPA: hypothetical protein VFA45_04415, partial [Actinomycetes bacterium]|nr:hypothetical protein [Actinomycetes bacterium]
GHVPPSEPAPPHHGGGGAATLFWVTAVQAVLVLLPAALAGQVVNGNRAALGLHQANGEDVMHDNRLLILQRSLAGN